MAIRRFSLRTGSLVVVIGIGIALQVTGQGWGDSPQAGVGANLVPRSAAPSPASKAPSSAKTPRSNKPELDLLADPARPAATEPEVPLHEPAPPRRAVHSIRAMVPPSAPPTPEMLAAMVAKGREVFVREWKPADRTTTTAADGLGPLFNGTSCVECHTQGGTGGAGPASKNVLFRRQSPFTEIVHRFGTSPKHANWRAMLLGREPDPALPEVKLAKDRESSEPVEYSERNATALFGVGLIDSIPQEVLLEVERKSFEYFPRTLRSTDKGLEGEYGGGRINRLSNGVLGRFGWKGQGASLREFTSAACAVELGLQHAFHTQPLPEYDEWESPANDLSEEDFQGLVAFVAALPAPRQELPESPRQRAIVELGKQRFAEVGCAECHLPNVGKVEGIYSDLLLHRMGPDLSGWGTDAVYGGFDRRRHSAMEGLCGVGRPETAAPEEWRTPPLWGCRDSAPYLHDGRAATLEKAIELHGGQGKRSADKYRALDEDHKAQLLAFLRSLAAPK